MVRLINKTRILDSKPSAPSAPVAVGGLGGTGKKLEDLGW